MRVKQISVFVENKPGRLEDILGALEKAQINIRALSISDSGEFGIVRMVLPHAEQSQESLREAGFTTRLDTLLAYSMPDVPGGMLNNVVKPLTKAGINLKYFYAYTDPATKQAVVVIKPDNLEKAEQILKSL
ncbi:MAG: ACT domain-containing protein [Dehalococcoidia bacterium]|nr:ACT domain-containing protein [Dehalococcoidia bacterium]